MNKVPCAALKVSSLLAFMLLGSLAQAAVRLPDVSCARTPDDARCKAFGPPASVGTGLPLALDGSVFIGSGYVDAASNSLLVPVEFGGQQDEKGVVMRVDLQSGNRTVVSGYSGTETRGRGVAYVSDRNYNSEAYDLGRVEVVRPGPGGSILALVDKGLLQRTELIQIDPKSGDRTLVWASKVFGDAARSGPTAIRDIEQARFNFGTDALCKGGDRVGLKPSETFETDGVNAYFFLSNSPIGSGIGLVRVPLSGGSCTWVSEYFPDGTSVVGSGATINTLSPLVFGSALMNGEFIAASGPNPSGNVLFGIDTVTGVRRSISLKNVSAPASSKGAGEALGYLGRIAAGPLGVATGRGAATDDYFEPTLVNLQSGDRTRSAPRSGSLKTGRDGDYSVVASVPGTGKFIVAFGKALHVWDPESGDSYLLSR